VTGRRGRGRKQLFDDLKENRGYCKLNEETLDSTMLYYLIQETLGRFGMGYGVVRQHNEGMNEEHINII